VHRIFLAIVLSLASLAALAQGSSLERFQTYLRTTQAARADFDQKVFDRTGKLVQESKGSFSFLRPGRFRWTYAKPNPQLIVGDGERVWVYDEDLKQVTVRKLASALGSTPAALLAGAADIEKAFELSDAGDKEGLAWVEARPREKGNAQPPKVEPWLAPMPNPFEKRTRPLPWKFEPPKLMPPSTRPAPFRTPAPAPCRRPPSPA